MKGVFPLAFTIAVGIGIGVGCANAENEDPLIGIGATEPADAGTKDGATSTKVTTPKKDTPKKGDDDDDDDDTTSSSSSSGGTSSSSSSGSASSSSSSSGSTSGSTSTDPCKATTCALAKNSGSISGDSTGPAKTITGATSQWFTIDVTEDVTGLFSSATDLSLTATLTSPAGKNFDLFLYLPDGGGTKECHLADQKSENTTGDDKARVGWSDSLGSRDDRTVSIEVREIVDPTAPAAACDPTAKWTLKLEGHK